MAATEPGRAQRHQPSGEGHRHPRVRSPRHGHTRDGIPDRGPPTIAVNTRPVASAAVPMGASESSNRQISEIAGARAKPLMAISGKAAGSDGMATRGASERAKTRETAGEALSGRTAPAPCAVPETSSGARERLDGDQGSASSAAPCADANAVIASSAAPTAMPTPRAAPISTQTASRSQRSNPRCSAGAPRQVRDARDEANTVDPSSDRQCRPTATPSVRQRRSRPPRSAAPR